MRGSGSEMSSPGVEGEDSQMGPGMVGAPPVWGPANTELNGHLDDHCLA